MRRILLSLLCAISVFTLGSAAPDKTPDFKTLYEGYETAVREMNVDQYMGFFANSLTVESARGETLDKVTLTKAQRETAAMVRVNGFRVQVESVTRLQTGDYAVVVSQEFDRDQEVAAGTKYNLRDSVVRRELWRETEAGWRIVEIEDLDSTPTTVRVKAWL